MGATLVIVIEKSGPDILTALPDTVLDETDNGCPIRVTETTLLPAMLTMMSDLAPKEPLHRPSHDISCCAEVAGFAVDADGVVPGGFVCAADGKTKAIENTIMREI